MTKAEIQTLILEQTGIKTSVKKRTGSMKIYICFSPMFQNGVYPEFPPEWRREFVRQFKTSPNNPNFQCGHSLDILLINIDEGEPLKYKKESKPKPIDPNKVSKGWGSKNSQLRLDKATARNAKKLQNGGVASYY